LEEDEEVGASLLHSKKPVSSGELTFIEEEGEVGASSRHSEKPVSSEEIMCIDDCLEVKELASREELELSLSKDKNSLSQFNWENILKNRNVAREDDEVYWDELSPNINGVASTTNISSLERKRKMVYEVSREVLYEKESQSSQSLGALPYSNQVVCSIDSFETAVSEECNIDAMVESGAQALRALSLKSSSSECCLSFLDKYEEDEGVVFARPNQVQLAQTCKDNEGVEVAINPCISKIKAASGEDNIALSLNCSYKSIMHIDDNFDTFISNKKEDLEEVTRNVLMKMTSPVGDSKSILRLRGGGRSRNNQPKKRKTNNKQPKQHLALAEVLNKDDVWPEYMNALSAAFNEVKKEEFKKPYKEMNAFEKMISMVSCYQIFHYL